MRCELDIGRTPQARRNEVNEDFAALVRGQGRDRECGAMAGMADAVSTGGEGREVLLHRCIKPDSLHLGEEGVLRVLDLGVALSDREPEATCRLHAGTPRYMNPEQLTDAGSDLFDLCKKCVNALVAQAPTAVKSRVLRSAPCLYGCIAALPRACCWCSAPAWRRSLAAPTTCFKSRRLRVR